MGPFGRVDLTPFLLIGSCLVLVWGLFRFRLLGIRPVARGLVFETISEAVLVLDPLRRVVDANPPAERLLGLALADAVGHPLGELLPEAAAAVRDAPTTSNGLPQELVVTRAGTTRRYEPTVVAMPDRPGHDDRRRDGGLDLPGLGQGPPLGWLVVLRDVTEHHRTLRSLRQLDEQRRSLLERVVTSQEEERRQVAGDIHDDAIQAMVAVTLHLQALGGRLSDPRSTELLERLAATATEASAGCASSCSSCARPCWTRSGWPPPSTSTPGGPASWLASPPRSTTSRPVSCPTSCGWWPTGSCRRPGQRPRPRQGGRVAVRLEEIDGGVLARVSDDGVGFLPGLVDRRPAGHLGLISMREQATMAGGWCRVASAPGMGTTVELAPPPGPRTVLGAVGRVGAGGRSPRTLSPR